MLDTFTYTASGLSLQATIEIEEALAAAVAGAIRAPSYTIPAGAIVTTPANLAATCNAAAAGSVVVCHGGRLRGALGSIDKTNLKVYNWPGEEVIFDGTDIVTGFVQSGSVWVKSGYTTKLDRSTTYTVGDTSTGSLDNNPIANWSEILFIDGVRQKIVSGTPSAGQFTINYTSSTLTLGTNPTGKTVEISTREIAAIIRGVGNEWRGFTFRGYGTGLGGANATVITTSTSHDLVMEDIHMEDCGQQSLTIRGLRPHLNRLTIKNAGCVGLQCPKNVNDAVIDRVWIDGANYNNWDHQPIAAGMKFSPNCHRVLIQNCVVTNCNSNGIWFDTDNFDDVVINNYLYNCLESGILTEANDNMIIAGNYVEKCLYGIFIMISSRTKLYNNDCDNNILGGTVSAWDAGWINDNRLNSNPATMGRCPWRVIEGKQHNNVIRRSTTPSGKTSQTYVLDRNTNTPAANMVLNTNNLYCSENSDGTSNRMVSWDRVGDKVIGAEDTYKTVAAFQAATGMVNYMTTVRNPSEAQVDAFDNVALPLPADVATALGVPTGTKIMGTVVPRPTHI